MTDQSEAPPASEYPAPEVREAGGSLPWFRLLVGLGVGLGVAILVVLLVAPHVGKDIRQATRAATQPFWLLMTMLALAVLLLADAASLVVLVRRLRRGVSVFWSGEVAFESHLVGGATSFGGLEIPYQMYLLRGLRLSLSEASSVVLIKGLVHTSVLAAVATIAILPFGISIVTPLQRYIIVGVLGVLVVVWIVGAVWLVTPIGLGFLPLRVKRWVNDFRYATQTLRDGGPRLIVPLVLLQLLYWIAMFSLIPLILHALGWRGPLAPIIVGQAVLQILMPFSPLPGGAGVAEFGYLGLIGQSVPADLVVPSLVLWRLCTWIIPMVLGAIALGIRTARKRSVPVVNTC